MSLHAYQITLLQAADDVAAFLAEVVRLSGSEEYRLSAERLIDRGSCWLGWSLPDCGGVFTHVALFRRRRTRRGFVLEPTDDGLAEWGSLWLPAVAQLPAAPSSLPEWASDVSAASGGWTLVDAVPNVRVVG